jgi:hypothetical protein
VAGTNSGAFGDSSSVPLRLRRPDAGECAATEVEVVPLVAADVVLGGADVAVAAAA